MGRRQHQMALSSSCPRLWRQTQYCQGNSGISLLIRGSFCWFWLNYLHVWHSLMKLSRSGLILGQNTSSLARPIQLWIPAWFEWSFCIIGSLAWNNDSVCLKNQPIVHRQFITERKVVLHVFCQSFPLLGPGIKYYFRQLTHVFSFFCCFLKV